MLNKTLRLLLTGGLTEEEYREIRDLRLNANYRTWRILSAFMVLFFLAELISTWFVPSVKNNIRMYEIMTGLSLICFVVFRVFRWDHWIIMPMAYIMGISLLIFGVLLGTVNAPDLICVTFHVLLVCFPLIMTDRPIYLGIVTIGITGFFIWECLMVKTGQVRELDIYDAVCFCVLGQFIGLHTVKSRMQGFLSQQRLTSISVTDGLTDLLNRRAYEEEMHRMQAGKIDQDLLYLSIDVNGLKRVNDVMGHDAGDELILGTAECMRKALGEYGNLYRTGGDEFIAILRVKPEQTQELLERLRKETLVWHGKQVYELALAVGAVHRSEEPDITLLQIAKLADDRMYAAKSAYYREKGIDRRRR